MHTYRHASTPGAGRRSTLAALVVAIAAFAIVPGARPTAAGAPQVRVKDLASVEGVRSNPLTGYGLVVGLKGTGDGTQAEFTIQSLTNMLRRQGIQVPQSRIRVKNVAAVMVTAVMPPFTRPGQTVDVQVSSVGDAKSLEGGTLLMTPLYGPDGGIYAVAQGAVSLGGGFTGGGGGNSLQKNHPTAGRVPGGALVERPVPMSLGSDGGFRLLLDEADFATASRVASAINEHFGGPVARAEDPVGIRIRPPEALQDDPVAMMAAVQAVEVRPDRAAKVVINERTGTVVLGGDVRVSSVALAHGNLQIEIATIREASQPAPLSETGRTVVVPNSELYVSEGPNRILALDEGVTVTDVVESLNAIGVSARDMIAIFQAMRAAGALHAELVIL